MYGISATPGVATYTDRWRADRYRIELAVEMPFDADDVDRALEKLGYHVVDADQAGRSYISQRDRNHLAELDDAVDWGASARLVLGAGDLEKAQIDQAGDYLRLVYEDICRLCRTESYLLDHDQWDGFQFAESELDRLHYPQPQ